jgi:hypothetical protein
MQAWISKAQLKSGWQSLADNKEQLTIMFTIIAAGYVLYEYRASQTDAKVKRSMDFQARYSEKEFSPKVLLTRN